MSFISTWNYEPYVTNLPKSAGRRRNEEFALHLSAIHQRREWQNHQPASSTIDLLPALEPSIFFFVVHFCSVRHIAIYLSLLFHNNKQYQNEVHSRCVSSFLGNCLCLYCSCIRPYQECRPEPRCTTNGVSFHSVIFDHKGAVASCFLWSMHGKE